MQARYGLIGGKLGHSFSPAYFRDKFSREGINACYEAFELDAIEQLPALLERHPDLQGLNVTIPYKEAVFPFVDRLSADAAAIGAVNCIAVKNGKLDGYNSDWIGFRDSLQPLLEPRHRAALVLGTGGAAKAVCFALAQLGIAYRMVSRSSKNGHLYYAALNEKIIAQHLLLINTTPLGMFPKEMLAPAIPYKAVTPKHLLYDLIYNPARTIFLSAGKARGAAIKNGHEMLVRQAEESWRIWGDGRRGT